MEWLLRFKNSRSKQIARPLRILGNNYIEDFFGYPVTMYIIQPLRHHQLRLARLKKPEGKDQRAPNNSGLNYVIRIPMNSIEAA